MKRLMLGVVLLAGCSADVRDQRAPEDHTGFVEVARQLPPKERAAFGTWWNDRSYKVKAGTATDADFNLTVREAIQNAAQMAEQRRQAAADRDARCGTRPCPIEPPKDPEWTQLKE